MDPMQADFIRKSRVKYLKCKEGGVHQGELMNFICIDPACKNKGLICPVCQTTSHAGHQYLHLKVFLSEIHKNLFSSDQQAQKGDDRIMSLSEQLRSIQTSKKEMEKVLRELVTQISEKVRQTEEKINHSYLSLRKIILSQCTISSKLPELYNLLTGPADNEEFIISQLNKFSQFLEYKNNKIHTIDTAQKLIEEYAKTASSVAIHLSTVLPEVSNKLANLPLRIKSHGQENLSSSTSDNLKFSETQKAKSIKLSNEGKEASISTEDFGGLVFVEGNSQEPVQKISFKVTGCLSDAIILGVGNPENYLERDFIMDESESFDLAAISSMGFPLNDFDTPSFVFGQGDIIDIEWNVEEVRLVFSRRNGIEKFELLPPLTPDVRKFRFFVNLVVGGDKVEIVQ